MPRDFDVNELTYRAKYEIDLTSEDQNAIRELLHHCFPDYFSSRIYNKQIPTLRILASHHRKIIGHLAADFRIASLDSKPHPILGIVDLCVRSDYRHLGIGSSLLANVLGLGLQKQIDFLVAFADEHKIYRNFGFIESPCSVRWLAIEEHVSLSVKEERLNHILLIKSIRGEKLPNATVDLLGYLF